MNPRLALKKADALLGEIESRLRNGEPPSRLEPDVAQVYRLLHDAGMTVADSARMVNGRLMPALKAVRRRKGKEVEA